MNDPRVLPCREMRLVAAAAREEEPSASECAIGEPIADRGCSGRGNWRRTDDRGRDFVAAPGADRVFLASSAAPHVSLEAPRQQGCDAGSGLSRRMHGAMRRGRASRRTKEAFEPIVVKPHAQPMADQTRGHRVEHLLEDEAAGRGDAAIENARRPPRLLAAGSASASTISNLLRFASCNSN